MSLGRLGRWRLQSLTSIWGSFVIIHSFGSRCERGSILPGPDRLFKSCLDTSLAFLQRLSE